MELKLVVASDLEPWTYCVFNDASWCTAADIIVTADILLYVASYDDKLLLLSWDLFIKFSINGSYLIWFLIDLFLGVKPQSYSKLNLIF